MAAVRASAIDWREVFRIARRRRKEMKRGSVSMVELVRHALWRRGISQPPGMLARVVRALSPAYDHADRKRVVYVIR